MGRDSHMFSPNLRALPSKDTPVVRQLTERDDQNQSESDTEYECRVGVFKVKKKHANLP